jgi:hypothetical protein
MSLTVGTTQTSDPLWGKSMKRSTQKETSNGEKKQVFNELAWEEEMTTLEEASTRAAPNVGRKSKNHTRGESDLSSDHIN